MPVEKLKGLQGLKGLNALDKSQYDAFVNNNRDLIAQHGYDPVYINNLYSNKQFIDKYGIDKFKAIPDIDMRNDVYRTDLVNTEFDKLYKPTKTNKGLGNDYNKYSQLSTDAKLKLLESDYLTPMEFENKWQKHLKEIDARANVQSNSGIGAFMPLGASLGAPFAASPIKSGTVNALRMLSGEEAGKKLALDRNQRIIDKIYNEDADNAASRYGSQVSQAYAGLLGMSDSQVKKAFLQAITPGKSNLGIAEYASHYGNGKNTDISSEMRDFSIDDMRQVLAKKQVYDAYMSPEMAATALNNDAKRYIKDHQGSFKRFGLFAKDVAISSMSYTADKLNGISELYRMGQDQWAEKPVVMVDDGGNVLDPNKTHIVKDGKGNLYYKGKDGAIHSVHKEQMDYTTLHNMGKNPDGSDIKGAFGIDWMTLNPQYWTRAEQFGTLDENLQKQYEKLGSSPYKVAYNPNEDSDLWYEAFKMMSFGIADAGSQLIPYGIGSMGKALSTADKVGMVARGFGKVLDTTGKMLTAETKVGQIAQGTAGALGIAYAYNRGAFQETLAQNLANAEEAVTNASKTDVFNQYNNDKTYKAKVDNLINVEAAKMKANYLAQMQRDGMKIADEKAIDSMLHAKAQDAVLERLVQNRISERKASKDYADLQQEAINSAGDAAFYTFLPEAIKYGFVNTLGYRKFLYTNPAGLSKKMSASLKGLKEITTSEGKKRMATEASKFLTRGEKLKEFGKTLGSQAWGGAWTNGTDDMQVDAAERINEDSYNRYLQAYQNGEAMADTYGFADGLYSYMKGLSNSMGQNTTWNSAIVGGLGSIVNVTPNFANIARLATKEGREAYRNNFRREIERGANGKPLKNEDGSVKYKELGKWNDWRGQLNYFIQNGVFNTYYGKKQSERDLQSHADYVNNILDQYDDFNDIERLVAANIASENMAETGIGDSKTMAFVKALNAVNALNNLGNSSSDPTRMSSVVQNAKTLVSNLMKLDRVNFDKGEDIPLSDEETANLLAQYYSANPNLEQNEYNNRKALQSMSENAMRLQNASEALDKAEKEIQKIERNKGITMDPRVRTELRMQQAFNEHWTMRKERMQSEIDDPSTEDKPTDASVILATVGGRKNAQSLLKVYDRQKAEVEKELAKQEHETESLSIQENGAHYALKEAKRNGYSNDILQAENEIKELHAKVQSSKQQEKYLNDIIASTEEKRNTLQASLDSVEKEEASENDRVLTADEIFSLDPVTRARMMNKDNREFYSKEQQREIGKLEQRLLMKDADALEKVQDISLLTQRIENNKDAYVRMAENPEAAAYALENQRIRAAQTAYDLVNQRNAEAAADLINQFDESMETHPDVTTEATDKVAFLVLRKLNFHLLDTMYNDNLLLQHNQQILDAKAWSKTMEDISAIVDKALDKDDAWKTNILKNIDSIVESSNNKEEIMANLEKVIDDVQANNPDAASDFEYILDRMEQLGYQRDATILESRKERKEREAKEAEERKKKEEEEKKAMKKSKAAAEKKAEESKEKGKTSENNVASNESLNEDSLEDVFDLGDEEKNNDAGTSEESTPAKEEEKSPAKAPEKPTESNKNYREKIADLGILPLDESPAGGIHNNPKDGKEGNLTSAQEKLIEKKVESVLDNLDSTESNLHDAIVFEMNTGDRSSANATILNYIYKVFNAYKQGKLTKEDTLNFIKEQFLGEKDNPLRAALESNRKKKESIKHIDFDIVTLIPASKYEILQETSNHKENANFEAHSAEKVDGDWYFIGNFAGSKEQTKVKSKMNADLEELYKEQQEDNPAVKGSSVSAENIIDDGENVQVNTETLGEQLKDEDSTEGEVHLSDSNVDASDLNGVGEHLIDTNTTTLSGNAMSVYDSNALQTNGKLVRKKGKKEGDDMDQYYAWMNAAGIKLQNIIDQELARIMDRNPHAKVRFMAVKPEHNATNDIAMQKHLMLVLDYDDSINKGITSIHDDSNGGVIESNGKKYLIIGVAGFGSNNLDKRALYDILWNSNLPGGLNLKKQRFQFFNAHPKERFYVNEELSTEVVPKSQIPGYIVRQTEKDDTTEYRSISELLKDKDRNPMGYDLQSLAWGIQEMSQFLIVGASLDSVMVPRNIMGNLGSAFVLMPASNGKLVPSYLKVLKYNEMNEGSLKTRIDNLLQEVISPNYKKRLQAVIELSNIFYLDKDGDSILLRKSKDEISLVSNGKIMKTFVLNDSFDRIQFMQAIRDMNPRINITARVLRSESLLQEYDEAGALMTDAALFGTAGSSYSIYGLDNQGNMVIPGTPVNETAKAKNTSDFKNSKSQVIYKHQYYREDHGVFSLNGRTITDEKLIAQLQYNKRIIDGELAPEFSKGTNDFYILSTGENPEVIRVDRNTKEVKVLSKSQADSLIKTINEQKEKELREENARKAAEIVKTQAPDKIEDVDLGKEAGFEIDEQTGEIVPVNEKPVKEEKLSEEPREEPQKKPKQSSPSLSEESTENLGSTEQRSAMQSFTDLVKNKKFKMRIMKTVKAKWKDAPSKFSDLETFLREKNVEVDNIGTSDKDIEAWIKTMEDCR